MAAARPPRPPLVPQRAAFVARGRRPRFPLLASRAMSIGSIGGTLALTISALLALAGCGERAPAVGRGVALAECRLPRLALAAQCGTLEVPEDRARPAGRKVTLSIAVLPANTLDPRPDPLFLLAGGPGQAASHLGPFAVQLTGVRKDRDIVLVDQRGTGRSSALLCEAFKSDDSLAEALDLDPVPRAASCARELAAKGVDAAQYTTAAWVEDLEAVRSAMGYPKINLWGGSYGTRAALEYLRRHPDRVRSAVLDGVVPPSSVLTLDVWTSRDRAVDAILRSCATSAACGAAHPDLDGTLASLRRELGPTGRDVPVADPRTGEVEIVRMTFDHVVASLHPLTYVPDLAALVPEAIGLAARGDYAPLFAATSRVTGALAEQMNAALQFSVTCAEDAPRIAPDAVARALAGMRSRDLALRTIAACDVWPRGAAPADAVAPVASDVPVLLISGGLDPVTPPSNGTLVAKTLPNSRHIVAAGYGHIVSPRACGPRLVAAFVDDPSFATLPPSCVRHFETSVAPLPWPDRMGPRP
jgi:pimeloyl-ACP methyl ester carboxylesterase